MLFFTFALAVYAGSLTWSSCGSTEDMLILESISFEPEFPKRGDLLQVRVKGELLDTFSQGSKILIDAKYGPVPVPRIVNLLSYI